MKGKFAALAQLVERRSRKAKAMSSTLMGGSKKNPTKTGKAKTIFASYIPLFKFIILCDLE